MALSDLHQELVNLITSWCEQKEVKDNFLTFVDTTDFGTTNQPPMIKGHRPDLAWQAMDSSFRFIGEAKTKHDIHSAHTRAQLHGYMSTLHEQGHGELIVAVPWGSENTTRSLLAFTQKKHQFNNCKWQVISNCPMNGDSH